MIIAAFVALYLYAGFIVGDLMVISLEKYENESFKNTIQEYELPCSEGTLKIWIRIVIMFIWIILPAFYESFSIDDE